MGLQALGLGVGLAVEDADLSSAVPGDYVAASKTFDRPDDDFLGALSMRTSTCPTRRTPVTLMLPSREEPN